MSRLSVSYGGRGGGQNPCPLRKFPPWYPTPYFAKKIIINKVTSKPLLTNFCNFAHNSWPKLDIQSTKMSQPIYFSIFPHSSYCRSVDQETDLIDRIVGRSDARRLVCIALYSKVLHTKTTFVKLPFLYKCCVFLFYKIKKMSEA